MTRLARVESPAECASLIPDRSTDLLADLLVQRIAEAVRQAGGTFDDPATVKRIVVEVLTDTEVSAEECSTFRESALANPDPIGAALGARIERALTEGVGEAVRGQPLGEELAIPRVIVLREGRSLEPDSSGETSTEGGEPAAPGPGPLGTLMETVPTAGAAPDHLWVIAQDQAFDAACEEADSLEATLGRTITVRPGGGEVPSPASESDLQLSAWKGGFGPAEEIARKTLRQLRSSSPTPAHARGREWSPRLMVGELLHGRYRLNRLIGEGGFGVVYEASDERIPLDTTYAIKILQPTALQGPGDVEAFQKEFERIQKCLHPNIVAVHNVDYTDEGLNYIVMERLVGEELDEWIDREGRMEPDRVARVLLQILAALCKAHTGAGDRSILHLDLKPGNVFVSKVNEERPDEGIKVLDFGIGQYVGAEEQTDAAPGREVAASPSSSLGTLRAAGPEGSRPGDTSTSRSRACTPEYAAPEHCAHCDPSTPDEEIRPLDGRADLYSVGAIGFQLLTGQLPHDRPRDRRDLLRSKRKVPPKNVRNMGVAVPKRLARFIDRCLEKDRDKRWKNADEAYEALSRIVHPVLTWRKVATVGGVPALLLAGGLYLAKGGESRRFALLDGTQTLATNAPLYLGPARSELSLRIVPEDFSPNRIREITGLQLIDSETGDVPPWSHSLEIPDGGSNLALSFEASASGTDLEGTYQVRGRLPGPLLGHPRGSVSTDLFRLEYLDEAWVLDGPLYISNEVGPGDAANRILDPDGLRLLYLLEGRTGEQVRPGTLRASLGAVEEPLTVDREFRRRPGGQTDDSLQAEFELSALLRELVPGGLSEPTEITLQLEVSDVAGGWVSSPESVLELESRALEDETHSIEVIPLRWDPEVAERYEFHKADLAGGVRFGVTLGRELGELSWELLDDQGQRIGQPRMAARGTGGAFNFTLRAADVDELVSAAAGTEVLAVYGRIHLTGRDSPAVIHADASRGIWEHTINFKYVLQELGFTALLNDRTAIPGGSAGEAEYFLTGTSENVLKVTPTSNSDTLIEVRALSPGVTFENGATSQSLIARRLNPGLFHFDAPTGEVVVGASASLPRSGGAGGAFEETESAGGDGSLRAGEHPYRIHVDQSAPKLAAWPPTSDRVSVENRIEENTERASFSLTIDDQHGGTLSWRLSKYTWIEDTNWEWRDAGEWSATWQPNEPIEIEFPAPWWKDGIESGDARWGRSVAASDGRYRVSLTVTDGAGNPVEAAPYEFEVAVHGPAIEILQPAPGGIWVALDSRDELYTTPRFIATVVVFDPNGLPDEPEVGHAAIAGGFGCTFVGTRDRVVVARDSSLFKVDKPTEGPERRLALERSFIHDWSEADLRMTVVGVDRFGNEGTASTSCKLPHIERIKPRFIVGRGVDRPELLVTPMCAVLRAGGLYEFGGRAKRKEVSDLARLGHQTFANSFYTGLRPWRVGLGDEQFEDLANELRRRREGVESGAELDRDALGGHYYIDEYEVTRGQFRQFVLAGDGYVRKANWPCGLQPDHEDLVAWKATLADGTGADRPITEVTWAEASAYAHWVGKRLPTAFEWEYAVRGGVEYRPFSTFAIEPGVEKKAMKRQHERIRFNRAKDGPWTAEESTDLTPETEIRDLSGNVREWTSTAVPPSEEHRDLEEYFGSAPTRAITPVDPRGAAPARVIVVGKSYLDLDGAFTPIVPRRRGDRKEDVGFRCAMSAKDVLDRLEKVGTESGAHPRVLLSRR